MEVIKPRPRPDMEEIFEDIDHLPTNKPLPDNGSILESLLESSLENEEIWIQAKTSIMCAEFAYNNKIHTATYISPFFANYGMNPRIGIEPWRAGKSELAK